MTQIDADSVKRTLKDVVIKGVTINSNSSAVLTFMDEDGEIRKMNLSSSSVIYMKNSRADISDIKIGYEADVSVKQTMRYWILRCTARPR